MKEHPRDDFVDASFPTEAASRLAAINEVKLLFRHADHLARVEQYRTEYAIKKEQAEQQLSSAIRNQVDETRLGLTILKQGVSNLSDIGLKFTSIDKLCEECEGLIQEWDVIKLVSRARVNMDATLRLVKKFSTIPERAKKLMDVLDDDETLIKDVYKDLRKLVQLRETAYEQSESFAHSFKDQLGSTFDCLQECADALEERVWENIGYCRVLAADDPTLLIRTLEVIEMEDGARRKVFSGIITPKHSSKAKSMRERMFEEMRASIADQFESLMKSFEETVEARKKPKKKSRRRHSSEDDDDEGDDEGESSDYEEQSEEDGAQKESPANAKSKSEHIIYIFDELKDLMEDLQEHREIIQPIFPPDHKIDVFYEREYRQWYKRVIVRHTSDSKELSKAETLKIVNFIQWYEKQLKVWTSYDPSVDRFDGLLEELLIVFIKSTETTIMTMMGNILRMDEESDPITDGDGCFATGGPSDLFITINGQLDIVFDSYGLRGKAVEYIAFMLGDVFTEHQNHQATFLSIVEPGEEEGQILLGPDRLPKDETYLAAIINNCQTCQDYIDEVQDRCIVAVHALDDGDDDDGESQDVEDRIVALLEEAAEGYVTVKLRAVDILVLQVISALEKPMKKLFTPAWFNAEDQEESVIEEILGTLQGYLEEYREWLSKEPPFSRIVKNCLHTLVSEYTQRFIQARPTCDETTFTLLREDREQFVALFTEYADNIIVPTRVFEAEIGIIEVIESVLTSDSDFISIHFEPLIKRFKSKAVELLRGLLSLRTDMSRADRKAIIDQFTEQVPEEYQVIQEEEPPPPAPLMRQGTRRGINVNAAEESTTTGRPNFWNNFKEKSKQVVIKKMPSAVKREQKSNGEDQSNSTAAQAQSPQKEEDVEAMDLADFLS